jgi:hypothetical protein
VRRLEWPASTRTKGIRQTRPIERKPGTVTRWSDFFKQAAKFRPHEGWLDRVGRGRRLGADAGLRTEGMRVESNGWKKGIEDDDRGRPFMTDVGG